MSKVPEELLTLKAGEMIEGGTFMQALSDEPLLWVCLEPFDEVSRVMVFDVSWLGVDLGRFEYSQRGMKRIALRD